MGEGVGLGAGVGDCTGVGGTGVELGGAFVGVRAAAQAVRRKVESRARESIRYKR